MPTLETFLGTVQKVLLHVGKTRLGYGGGDGFLGRWGSEARFRHISRRCCRTSRFGGDFGALPFVEGEAGGLFDIDGGGPVVGVLLPELTFVGVTR